MMKPEPSEVARRSGMPRRFRLNWSKKSRKGDPGGNSNSGSSSARPSTFWVVEILTTAGSSLAARSAKLRSEEHTSELQSLLRISYAVFCLKKQNIHFYLLPHHIINHT